MKSLRPFALLLMTLEIGKLFSVECRDPVLHRVGGGRNSWAPEINFSDWSTHQQFFVGDWLYFGFNKQTHNVLEVNKTSFDTCDDTNYMSNVTRGGRDVFNLTEAKVFYFLCGRGFCSQGMKVQIPVHQIPPSPSPTPDSSTSSIDLRLNDASTFYNIGFFRQTIFSLAWLVLLLH